MYLFKVTCRGMTHTSGGATAHGLAYVVAKDSAEAYRKVRDELERIGVGFRRDRELLSVEVIAEAGQYPACGIRLYQ